MEVKEIIETIIAVILLLASFVATYIVGYSNGEQSKKNCKHETLSTHCLNCGEFFDVKDKNNDKT